MPLSFDTNGGTGPAAAAAAPVPVMPEIISQHQRLILGAIFENLDVQFVPEADARAFADMREGALARDEKFWFQKVQGARVYFASDKLVQTGMADLETRIMRALQPIVVTDVMPTAPSPDGIRKGQQFRFAQDANLDGKEVELGATAYANADVKPGDPVPWASLDYFPPGAAGEEVPDATPNLAGKVKLTDGPVRTDGAATPLTVPTELGVAQALDAQRSALQEQIDATGSTLQDSLDAVSGRIPPLAARLAELESGPQPIEEVIEIGDGSGQIFTIPLTTRWTVTPQISWHYLVGDGTYIRINEQDGQVDRDGPDGWVFRCAFAGPPTPSQFRVILSGPARLVT